MSVAAIAFTPAPRHENPNLRVSSKRDAADSYYDAMIVVFASIARWGAGPELRLVTDVPIPLAHRDAFESIGVATLPVDFTHRPPQGFATRFNASLYSIDALGALSQAYPQTDIALLDPDCLAIRPIDDLLSETSQGIGVFPTGFPIDEDSNGLSARQAADLHHILDSSLTGYPVHYGGECYVFRAEEMKAVLERAERAFELSLQRAEQSLPRFTTEEHILNFALRGARLVPLNHRVDRIWTAPTYRTVTRQHQSLDLWHLPAEKDRGFVQLRKVIDDRASWFWTSEEDEFHRRLGKTFGIPRRSAARWTYDSAARLVRRIQP